MRRWIAGLVAAVLVLTAAPLSAGEGWRPHMRRAIRYAEGREGSISFAIKDKRGRFYGYRQRRTVPSASVFKAMMLAAYLRHPSVRDRRLRGWERDLMRAMIRWSDNDAT